MLYFRHEQNPARRPTRDVQDTRFSIYRHRQSWQGLRALSYLSSLLIAALVIPLPAFAAIARDSHSSSGLTVWHSGTSLSYTNSGGAGLSNTLGLVAVYSAATIQLPTSVTWGGSAMSLATSSSDGFGIIGIYCKAAAAEGSQTVSISWGETHTFINSAASLYTGAQQNCTPDSLGFSNLGATTSLTIFNTTVADNAWIFGIGYWGAGSTPVSAGTNTNLLDGVGNTIFDYDTNGAQTPAGSHSTSMKMPGSSQAWGMTMSFGPAAAAAASPPSTIRNFMIIDD